MPYPRRTTTLSVNRIMILDPVAALCACMGLSSVVRSLACTRRSRRGAVLGLFANYGGLATGFPFVLPMGRSGW